MKIQHFQTDKSKTIYWAHGTSTELFIFPPQSNFQSRNFLFRISTATVEAEETTFSSFPTISRTLMVLEGDLTLIHEGRYTKHLHPFDQDTFDGGWITKSRGKVTDFNLMCRENARGNLQHHALSSNTTIEMKLTGDFDFIYVESGSFYYEEVELTKGDILVINRESFDSCLISCNLAGHLVQVSVSLND